MLPKDFLTPIDGTNECSVCVRKTTDSFWTMGTAGMRGYYMGFDTETAKISVTPFAGSDKETVKEGIKPTRVLGLNILTVSLLSSGIGVFVLALIILIIFAFCQYMVTAKTSSQSGEKKLKESPAKNQLENLSQEQLVSLISVLQNGQKISEVKD